MKRIFTSMMVAATLANVYAARVELKVTGLEAPDAATLSIASYSWLETMSVTADGDYAFDNVPDGTHYLKIEAPGYESSPSKTVVVADGVVTPSEPIRLGVTRQSGDADEWSFKWEMDGSPSGYTQTSHVNNPVEIEFLGKKIVPADVAAYAVLEKDYHIYLDDSEEPWTQEYAYRLLETLKTLPVRYDLRPYASFTLTSQPIADDIKVTSTAEGSEVVISKDAFYYANPFLVDLDGVRGRLFSKRLHHAMTDFVTDFGNDKYSVNRILETRFGCKILNVDYETLTAGITDETSAHFQAFLPSETVAIINMLEELPEGFHATPHLKYLVRRINGMLHPLYPQAAAVSWPVDNGYIEFMESAFGANNDTFDTLRLILHEKSHFLWAYTFSDEIKNDWIELGGWYEDCNSESGWSTTKDVEFVSAYAHGINPNEDMAESIAYYLRNPDLLMSRSPEKYAFIRDRIMHGTRYISKIPDHLTFEVLNLHPDYDYPGKIKGVKVTAAGAADADKTVAVEIELSDIEGYDDGASKAYVRLSSPTYVRDDGTMGSAFIDLYMYPVDETGHILRGKGTVSRYSKSGHWSPGDITVTDLQGNQRFAGQNDYLFDLYIDNALEDVTPPRYEGDLRYTVTDTVIEGHQAQNLEVRFKVSENVGMQEVMVRIQAPDATYSKDVYGKYLSETSEGVVNVPITEFYRTGDYYASCIMLKDRAGNAVYTYFSGDASDQPIQYVHIETSNPDTEHPEIDLQRITVYAEPTHPEAPDGETLVTISFFARDDKSGLGQTLYRLRDPQGIDHINWYYHRNFHTTYFDGDPTVWERYVIKTVLPQGSAPGIWGLAEMKVTDKANNTYVYNFVETLIFEPDNDMSQYELFADIENGVLAFGLNALTGEGVAYRWRIIHEESGLELRGSSEAPAASRRRVSKGDNVTRADLSAMPDGDLVLIVEALGEDGTVTAVKTKRVSYTAMPVLVEAITLNASDWNAATGDTRQLEAVVSPANASDKTLQWTSSDENVATVDENGLVTVKGEGKCVITAATMDGTGLKATCTVTCMRTGVDAIFADEHVTADVYSTTGVLVKRGCTRAALRELAPGCYIVRNADAAATVLIH